MNRERYLEYQRNYNKTRVVDPIKAKQYQRTYYLRHTDELRARSLAYYYSNHEENKRKNRESVRRTRAKEREQVQKQENDC